MLNAMLKRMMTLFGMLTFGSSAPWAMPSPKMSMTEGVFTRQKLNELLQQTPSIPTPAEKQPV